MFEHSTGWQDGSDPGSHCHPCRRFLRVNRSTWLLLLLSFFCCLFWLIQKLYLRMARWMGKLSKSMIEQQLVFKGYEIWSNAQQMSNTIIKAHTITPNLICVACEVKLLNLVMMAKKRKTKTIFPKSTFIGEEDAVTPHKGMLSFLSGLRGTLLMSPCDVITAGWWLMTAASLQQTNL